MPTTEPRMHRVHRISRAYRDLILARSYPQQLTVESAKLATDGWQHIFWDKCLGIGVPPIEFRIKAGDCVTLWFRSPGHAWGSLAQAFAVNDGPAIIYPQALGMYDDYAIVVVDTTLHEAEEQKQEEATTDADH